jgi:hypothetical protein
MGAANFETVSSGKTAKEAFSRAVERAQYEYGHGGYSGTIAEKGGDGYSLLRRPEGHAKAQTLIGMVWNSECDGAPSKPPIRRKFDSDWDRRSHEYAKALYAKWAKLSAEEQAWVLSVAENFSDKWGACAALELTNTERKGYSRRRGERTFVFFGWASS